MRASFATALVVVVCSLAAPVSAQTDPSRGGLEIAFDHGVTQVREPGEQIQWSGAHLALDARLHAPSGFGGMVRVGTTLGGVMTLEADTGATYRAWLHRRGPRGLQLGGGVGASVYWNALAPRIGYQDVWAAGGFLTVQLDYREHGFLVGIGYVARVLPVRGGDPDMFTFAATLRVGGELSL